MKFRCGVTSDLSSGLSSGSPFGLSSGLKVSSGLSGRSASVVVTGALAGRGGISKSSSSSAI